MRRSIILSVFIITVALVQFAHGAAPEGTAKATVDAVKAAGRATDQAYLKKDVATLKQYLADEYVGSWPDGSTTDKKQELSDLESGKYKMESVEYKEEKITLYGNMAVAFVLAHVKEEFDGKKTEGDFRNTGVMILRDGRWQTVAVHASKVGKN